MKILESVNIATRRRDDLHPGQIALSWLGQAGFLVESQSLRFLIDPYLSDSLAEKYRGSRYPHERLMSPPVAAELLEEVDYCFSTHGHTDHLDPGTLPVIARNNPLCRFVIPRSCRRLALERGLPEGRLMAADAGVRLSLGPLEVEPLPSAHEERRQDEEGNELFLGYLFRLEGRTFYHSGDGIPYPGLENHLKEAGIELFLMPVNGRDEERRRNGVPGNFTLAEAAEITRGAGGSALIGHHYGMFAFNTVDPDSARRWIEDNALPDGPLYRLAELNREYRLG